MKNKSLTLAVAFALGVMGCQSTLFNTQTEVSSAPLESGISLTAIDPNTRPQDDFFRHVNGNWLNKTEIPADKSRFSIFNTLYDDTQDKLKVLIQQAADETAESGSNTQKLGDMYSSYMDVERANELGIKPLETELSIIAAVDAHQDVASVMGKLAKLGVKSPLGFYVYADAKKPGVNALYLSQYGLTLPDKSYYSNPDDKYVGYRNAMVSYIAALLSETGHSNPEAAAKAVLAFETKIADAQLSRVESRDAEKMYNKRTASELTTMLKGFDWNAYASATELTDVETLVVRQLPYFKVMGELFSNTDVETLKDYMTFQLVSGSASLLSKTFVDLRFDFFSKTLRGVPENQPRWKRAVAATSGVLGEVLGQQYVAQYFTPAAKDKMDELVANLIEAYGQSIRELDWMTEETKQAALVKLSKFTPKIGYPDKWQDYSALTINADDLVGNYKRYNEFRFDESIAKIGQPIDTTEWGMTPQTINAYYSPVLNEIVFPAGILQAPFFSLTADDAVNYGAIGAVIGHEIGHGFDDQGSKYDGDGNLNSWWSDADRAAFDKKGKKLSAQFSAYQPIKGSFVNGDLTLGENIGDLAGISIGLKAYINSLDGQQAPEIDGFTGIQRVFMGYAQVWRGKYREDALRSQLLSDPHSPGEYRVNGIVTNVDAFYEAFDVKPGDEMYLAPEQRVNIW